MIRYAIRALNASGDAPLYTWFCSADLVPHAKYHAEQTYPGAVIVTEEVLQDDSVKPCAS